MCLCGMCDALLDESTMCDICATNNYLAIAWNMILLKQNAVIIGV